MKTLPYQAVRNPFFHHRLQEVSTFLESSVVIMEEVLNLPDNRLEAFDEPAAEVVKATRTWAAKVRASKADLDQTKICRLIVMAAQTLEDRKTKVHRFAGFRMSRYHDDAWRRWVVLTLPATALILKEIGYAKHGGQVLHSEKAEQVLGELWSEMGFDPSPTPESDVSPTGRMFRRALMWKLSSGRLVLVQSGGRDV